MGKLNYKEFIGYRANCKTAPNKAKNGEFTVYAERRKDSDADGRYGGDAYPVVYEKEFGKGLSYGMILADDGLGSGNFVHPSLSLYLDKKVSQLADGLNSEDTDKLKLSVFLRNLYGNAIFSENEKETLEYALKSFTNSPLDGYFAAMEEEWKSKNPNYQNQKPFYEKDSQTLGSRIVCVGLYYKFRNYVLNNLLEKGVQEWTDELALDLRSKVEEYLSVELYNKIHHVDAKLQMEMFPFGDAKTLEQKEFYFLPSTVAAWFYVVDNNKKTVSALSLNCGDARCYVFDLDDGVRQITVDDAKFGDSDMSAMVHFGTKKRMEGEYHDGEFNARIVNLKMPCALFACSDGIYDTCVPNDTNDGKLFFHAYEQHQNSFLFECNLQQALRRSFSYEDFARELVFNIFGQKNTQCAESFSGSGDYFGIKNDDSGTVGARFFGESNGLELFEKLRKVETTLDKLYNLIERTYSDSYYMPRIAFEEVHIKDNSYLMKTYASGDFKKIVSDTVKANYSDSYDEMAKDGSTVLWGVTENNTKYVGLFAIGNKFLNNVNMYPILLKTVDDWNQYKVDSAVVNTWKKYESLLVFSDILSKLDTENYFDNALAQFGTPKEDLFEKEMSDWFLGMFYSGSQNKDRKVVTHISTRPSWEEEEVEQKYREFKNPQGEVTADNPKAKEEDIATADVEPSVVESADLQANAEPSVDTTAETKEETSVDNQDNTQVAGEETTSGDTNGENE